MEVGILLFSPVLADDSAKSKFDSFARESFQMLSSYASRDHEMKVLTSSWGLMGGTMRVQTPAHVLSVVPSSHEMGAIGPVSECVP